MSELTAIEVLPTIDVRTMLKNFKMLTGFQLNLVIVMNVSRISTGQNPKSIFPVEGGGEPPPLVEAADFVLSVICSYRLPTRLDANLPRTYS